MIWEKSSDQSSCLNLNLTFYLKLTSDHCAKCVTVIWCDLKIKAKVQVQAWTLIWTFFSDHRNELILIWTLWTIYNSVWRPTSERIGPGENLSKWPEIARALRFCPKFFKNHWDLNPKKISRGLLCTVKREANLKLTYRLWGVNIIILTSPLS